MNGSEAVRVLRQIESSEGIKIYRQAANLKRSYEIMCLNFADLERLLTWFSVPANAISIMDRDHPERMNEFWMHASRHIHNYLASVNTLIDHMRRFVGKETHGEFMQRYEEQKNRLMESPLSAFVPDLRSYVLHNDVPPVGSVLSAGRTGNTETYITLDCAQLLKWGKWKSSSRRYLAGVGSSVKVVDIIRQYHSMMVEFFTWFQTELLQTYNSELHELYDLDRKLRGQMPR